MLLFFTKHAQFMCRCENFSRKKIRHLIPWSNKTFRIGNICHPNEKTGFIKSAEKSSYLLVWIQKIYSSDEKPTRRTCAGRRQADEDPNFVPSR